MTEKINQLLAEGKVSSAAVLLAKAACILSDQDFKNLNQKIRTAKKTICRCPDFPSPKGRNISVHGPRFGNGHQ